MKLSDFTPGQSATITGFEKGDSQYRNKLLSLGLTRGTQIDIMKIAPLGDPVEVETRGFRLSLRKAEAKILILEQIGRV